VLAKLRKAFLLAVLLLVARRRRRQTPEPERIVAAGQPEPTSELVVALLLLVGALFAIGFVVVYALDRLPDQTQLLGASLGLSLLAVAAALILAGKRLVVSEELTEDYPPAEHPDAEAAIVQIVEESGSRITRGRVLRACAAFSSASLAAALVAPAASLGPVIDTTTLTRAPWRRGRRLVDENGSPYRAAAIEQGGMYTAFPEGADTEDLGSSLVVVRIPVSELALPAANSRYDADGIVAFSKICTHAGCAITLYRAPLFQPNDPRPALVCPCHYSTFDPVTGGTVVYGPAGRKLPMLPLQIDRNGELRAAGTFDGPVGPSWWGVRRRRPTA
jgi:ubiquinol-cytochrome c reductase iron-sulfur subunit